MSKNLGEVQHDSENWLEGCDSVRYNAHQTRGEFSFLFRVKKRFMKNNCEFPYDSDLLYSLKKHSKSYRRN